jgi:glycosyltransferase involved in cell wall biosynthesis
MRIAVFDNWLCKFSNVLIKHWEDNGHTVLYEPGFNPNLIETCDRVFFESADTNVHLACQQRPHKKGKVFLRAVDIDIHVNGLGGVNDYLDGIMFVAESMRGIAQKRNHIPPNTKTEVIPMGVDTDKFTFRQHSKGNKIAFIATRLTPEKGFDRALHILAEARKQNPNLELHAVGRMFENSVWQMHIDHILDSNNMRESVKFHDNLPYETGNEINEFLEDKDYMLLSSHKEAFSFVTAEAMSKGIKPIIYNFYGAQAIWGTKWLFNTPQEAVQSLLSDDYASDEYRQYIVDNYPLQSHLERVDSFMEIC